MRECEVGEVRGGERWWKVEGGMWGSEGGFWGWWRDLGLWDDGCGMMVVECGW